MKNTNQLGLWMDDTVAYLIEFSTKPFEIQTIVHEFLIDEIKTNQVKENKVINNSNEPILSKHYNKIGKVIVKYKKIVLFGPSEAKLDFFNILSEDERFLKLKIEVKDADNMNVNQQHDFIKEYFGHD